MRSTAVLALVRDLRMAGDDGRDVANVGVGFGELNPFAVSLLERSAKNDQWDIER